jgi:hypothetical protein
MPGAAGTAPGIFAIKDNWPFTDQLQLFRVKARSGVRPELVTIFHYFAERLFHGGTEERLL